MYFKCFVIVRVISLTRNFCVHNNKYDIAIILYGFHWYENYVHDCIWCLLFVYFQGSYTIYAQLSLCSENFFMHYEPSTPSLLWKCRLFTTFDRVFSYWSSIKSLKHDFFWKLFPKRLWDVFNRIENIDI